MRSFAGTFSKGFRIYKKSNFLEQKEWLFPKVVWSVGLTFEKYWVLKKKEIKKLIPCEEKRMDITV